MGVKKNIKIKQGLILSYNEDDRSIVLDPTGIKLCELNNAGLAILSACNGKQEKILSNIESKGIDKKTTKSFISKLVKLGLIQKTSKAQTNENKLLDEKEIDQFLKSKNEPPTVKECDLSYGYFSKHLPK